MESEEEEEEEAAAPAVAKVTTTRNGMIGLLRGRVYVVVVVVVRFVSLSSAVSSTRNAEGWSTPCAIGSTLSHECSAAKVASSPSTWYGRVSDPDPEPHTRWRMMKSSIIKSN